MAAPYDFYGTPALWTGDYQPQGALSGFFSDPQQVGLLSAAAGLLQAGGPSRFPVSTGQALGQGLGAGIGAFNSARDAQFNNAMRMAHANLFQQQARKAQLDAELTELASKGGLGMNSGDPDTLEMLGSRLAAAGHPGGATLIDRAEKIRAARQNAQAVDAFRSAPGTLGAGVTTNSPQGQALLSNLTGDPQFDQAVLAAQNEALNSNPGLKALPVTAPNPGLMGPLFNSPYVGQAAQALQRQIDITKGIPAQTWLTQAQHLQQQDQTAMNAAAARDDNAALRRDLANQNADLRREIAAGNASGRNENRQNLQDQRDFSNERNLSNDYSRLTADFRQVLPGFQASARYIAGGKYNSSGDRDLAFSFARTLDPKDRVGVNDIKDINKLGNVPERIQQAIVGLAEGKELPDRIRREMFDVMRRRFGTMNEQQQQIEDEYESRAKQYMLAPNRVVQRFAIRNTTPSARQSGATGGWSVTRE